MKNKKVKAGKLPKPKKVKLLGKDFIELSHKVADILEEEGRIPKQEKECNYKDWYKLQMYTDNPNILEPLRKGEYKGLIDELVVWREEPPKESCVCPSCDYSKNNCRDCDYCKEKKESCPCHCHHREIVPCSCWRMPRSEVKTKCKHCEEKQESWRDELQGIFLKPWTSKDIEAFIEKQIDSVKAQAYKDIMIIRKNGEEMSKITIERLERDVKEAKREVLDEIQGHLIDKGKLDGCFYLPKGFWVSLKHKEELE